jgi:hypothetical protein
MRTELFRKGIQWSIAFLVKHKVKILAWSLMAAGCLAELIGFSYWVDALIHPPGRWWAFAKGLPVVPGGFILLVMGLQYRSGKRRPGKAKEAMLTTGTYIVEKVKRIGEKPSGALPISE